MFFQGRRESCVTGELMARKKEVLGGSSKEKGNHGLLGSSCQEIKEVLGVLPRKKGIMSYRGAHGKK